MNKTIPALVIALGAILAFQPLRGDTDAPRMDVIGVLVSDATCPLATHVLLNPCTRAPALYVVFQPNKSVDRFVGYIVSVRGTTEFTSCALPLLHATRIVRSDLLFPCPPPMCNPGDPPPCP